MRLIIITGQTATGKTKLALEYARKYHGELINFDSRQVYKYLDIITGKDINKNKIQLYDVVDPKYYFSSFNYLKLVIPAIKRILLKNKTPILVGGSYFYLYHLFYDVDSEKIPPDWSLRNRLSLESVKNLQNTLRKLDPSLEKSMNHSDWNNPRRLIRKIEILSCASYSPQTPQSPQSAKISLANKLGVKNLLLNFIGLRFKSKEKLITSIKKRVENRLIKGAIQEVKSLIKMGYSENDPGLKTIGYQQIIQYLKGDLTKEQAINQWITKEIQYAKRQYTFMKKDRNIKWREV